LRKVKESHSPTASKNSLLIVQKLIGGVKKEDPNDTFFFKKIFFPTA